MKLLLHACCGPCALAPVELLQGEGLDFSLYYSNPNIHPYLEWRQRRDNLSLVAAAAGVPLTVDESYPIEDYLRGALAAPDRCAYCYRTRLTATANQALAQGCDSFSTTLLISPYQNHEAIAALGREIGAGLGLDFYYRDFRPLFRQGQAEAQDRGLYRQKYCGCIFSEVSRYRKTKGQKTRSEQSKDRKD